MANPSPQTRLKPGQYADVLTKIETTVDQMIANLPSMNDAQVLSMRDRAQSFGKQAWRLEVAADAEIERRAKEKRLKPGPAKAGEPVKTGGTIHSLAQAAKERGVNASTIRRNASIHKIVLRTEKYLEVLPDKEFFKAAVCTKDPVAAVKKFAEKKKKDPSYKPKDAWREVKREKLGPPPNLEQIVPFALNDPIARKIYSDILYQFRLLVKAAPHTARAVRNIVADLNAELTRPEATLQQLILDRISNGEGEGTETLDNLAKHFGIHREHMREILKHLVSDKLLTTRKAERKSGARGATVEYYELT